MKSFLESTITVFALYFILIGSTRNFTESISFSKVSLNCFLNFLIDFLLISLFLWTTCYLLFDISNGVSVRSKNKELSFVHVFGLLFWFFVKIYRTLFGRRYLCAVCDRLNSFCCTLTDWGRSTKDNDIFFYERIWCALFRCLSLN